MRKPKRSACLARERKSKFVDIFRTTPTNTVCPNFYVLCHADGCSFAPQCSYCYLKSSFWYLPAPQVFTNTEKMVSEIGAWIAKDDLESYTLNMGNLSDSLVFEDVRPLVSHLVELFREEAEARGRRHTLLLVTKGGSRECRVLLDGRPCRSVVVSFSFNSPEAARKHELGAAPVDDRLKAARDLKAKGWRVRGRIDPMILGFDYAWTIEQVRRLAPERVTLGTLRAEPNLPRFIENGLFDALEAPPDKKGLARYPKEQRLALYRQAVAALSSTCPIGLCEETPDIWDALGLDTEAKCCNCGS
jgi:DNA repair photolyase